MLPATPAPGACDATIMEAPPLLGALRAAAASSPSSLAACCASSAASSARSRAFSSARLLPGPDPAPTPASPAAAPAAPAPASRLPGRPQVDTSMLAPTALAGAALPALLAAAAAITEPPVACKLLLLLLLLTATTTDAVPALPLLGPAAASPAAGAACFAPVAAAAAASAAWWMAAGRRDTSAGVTGSRNASEGGTLTCSAPAGSSVGAQHTAVAVSYMTHNSPADQHVSNHAVMNCTKPAQPAASTLLPQQRGRQKAT